MRTSTLLTSALAAALFVAPVALAPVLASPVSAATPTVYGGIWVADSGGDAIRAYTPGATGAAVPTAVITGADTGLHAPVAVAVAASGTIVVVNSGNDSITEYAANATGDAHPTRTIIGPRTGLDAPTGIALAQGQIWTTDPAINTVEAFDISDKGDALPAQTIAGSKTGLNHPTAIAVDFPFVSVLSTPTTGPASISVYLGENLVYGNLKPTGTLTGTKSTLLSPTTIANGPNDTLLVNDTANNSVSRLSLFAVLFGFSTPAAPLKGASTGLNDPTGLAIDAKGDLLVANAGDHSVRVFKYGAKGNTAPFRTITGVGTAPGSPAAVAVFGISPGAPTQLHATPHGSSATLHWKAPAVTGGGLIGYQVVSIEAESAGSGITELVGTGTAISTTATSVTVHHLKNGQPYFFAVVAYNGFGFSAPSNLTRFFISTPPTAPRHVKASAHDSGFAVSWTAPKSTGGRTITGYLVQYSTCVPGAKHCAFSERAVSGKVRHTTALELRAGETYHVRVLAHNAAGYSAPSAVVKVTTAG